MQTHRWMSSLSQCRASGTTLAIAVRRVLHSHAAKRREAIYILAECAGLATKLTGGAGEGCLDCDLGVDAVGAAMTRNLCDLEAAGAGQAATMDVTTSIMDWKARSLDKHLCLHVLVQCN